MLDALRSLIARKRDQIVPGTPRARLTASEWPAVIYAVGDVHGCLDELLWLEDLLVSDARDIEGERWIITLGDHIDRGPRSAQVIEHLIGEPPPGFRRISLAGNHEQMLLDFLAEPTANSPWLEFGGLDTARSYGLRDPVRSFGGRSTRAIARDLASLIPEAHLDFLRNLPISLSLPGFHFVHAGLRPGVAIEEQTEADLLWIRDPFLEQGGDPEAVVVHGHTPTAMPEIRSWRIGIDTGAFASGRLTAARLRPGETPTFIATGT